MSDHPDILAVLRKNIDVVRTEKIDGDLDLDRSLSQMGVDSLDSVQVLFDSMKDLGIRAMDINVFQGKNIREMVEILKAKMR